MKNSITKNLIILFGAVIFSLAMANSVSASYPNCVISNFKANGRTSITVSSGDSVTLYWSTTNCGAVELTGRNISSNVAQSGYMTINPTASSDYNINAAYNNGYPVQSQKIEVTVIPTAPIATTVNSSVDPVQYIYSPTTSTTTAKTNITNTSTSKNTTTKNTTVDNTKEVSNNLGASANNSGITALSLRGSGSFMPSSIWQWLLVIVLILIIIIIARTFVKKPSPGDHDTHAAHAH